MKIRALVLLSGEGTNIPLAEAKSLFLAYDPKTEFSHPSPRVLLADTEADPFLVGSRIAYARRVGPLVEGSGMASEMLKGRTVRFRSFRLRPGGAAPGPERYMKGIEAKVELMSPDYEVSLVQADDDYLAITSPGTMRQGWSSRRPRRRPYFHPSAIFPKLSRALVNMSGCREGDVFLDPFCGTGSLPLEASMVGARVLAVDQAQRMARGSLANMRHFGEEWLGAIRADSALLPVKGVDAVATDMPYGRASSTRGRTPDELLRLLLASLSAVMKPGSALVLMHPHNVRVEGARGFRLSEEHHLQVHKLLTRTITVLRRR